jgi:hypothetical protein
MRVLRFGWVGCLPPSSPGCSFFDEPLPQKLSSKRVDITSVTVFSAAHGDDGYDDFLALDPIDDPVLLSNGSNGAVSGKLANESFPLKFR